MKATVGEKGTTSGACLDAIVNQIGKRRWVLLGEATHGTHEFYAFRAALTKRLIEERGFRTVAVEGEWHTCFRVNRFLRPPQSDNPGTCPSHDASLREALEGFSEFPKWVWRNQDTTNLLQWLQAFNSTASEPVRWYGLDVQGSLREPAEFAIRYAENLDPAFGHELRCELQPFLKYATPSELGRSLAMREECDRLRAAGQVPPANVSAAAGVNPTQLEVTLERLLATMQRRNRDDFAFLCPIEEALAAEQCLDVLLAGQEYYRKQYSDVGVTWNLRDQHMVSTVMRLAEHLEVQFALNSLK